MLEVRNLVVAFDDNVILKDLQLSVEQGEIVCLLGPSGCGKTTLLRAVAGLETPVSGDIIVSGQNVTRLPVHQRGFGLMFQDFALFPHMNVAENVLFGLKMQHLPKGDQQNRMREVLELVGLQAFANRKVNQLSGGERQRVALARSLAPKPRLLMLDEPLGALDANLRDRLVIELREIIKQVSLTAIYVTHDQEEAFAVSDRIAVMNAGRIEQIAAPQTVYSYPETVFVARFLGFSNIVDVQHYDGATATTSIGQFPLSQPADAVLIHPDKVSLKPNQANAIVLQGRVVHCVFQGDSYRLQVQLQNGQMFGISVAANNQKSPEVGASIELHFSENAIIPLKT